ncbi:hypothetical protein Tdes44962_MAKER04151 [Teratosphaeria destructans]|uniref:Oxidoreductase-like protein n=1 Tax=Teratosphaeria destructans TaxID=418781 RepID=A0A9W7SN76_9PEZI|nr:hypothetical protein Tdes44962_MAKER04151 [Teratosphaeria destructans]
MAPTVEAGSLTSITNIATHPPQHPAISPPPSGQPLVLYIARVPGSRDVFLTPIKPRDKVVSAYDIHSSLYYVHISSEDDQQIVEPSRAEASSANTDACQLSKTIRRKPMLPQRPCQQSLQVPYPTDNSPPVWDARPPSPPRAHRVPRKPVFSDITNSQPPHPPPHVDLPQLSKRLLPTPPPEPDHRDSVHAANVHLLRHSDHSPDNNPYFRRYEGDALRSTALPEIGLLTLIRRDPASCEQWNVGYIHDPPIYEVSSPTLLSPSSVKRTKRGGAPLYLDITNPGYAQFIDHDRPESRTSSSANSDDSEQPPEGIFRRRLYMPGSRYAEHGYEQRRVKSSNSGHSADKLGTGPAPALSKLEGNSASPSIDRRSKGYSFTSPWEGRCEFSTGATGKSLKCRHTLAQTGTVEVSELRFNLPTSSRVISAPVADKRSSYFSRHSRLLSSEDGSGGPSFVINEDGRVDLSLGQEKAGGGFGGKQAKLGKLIVYPDGLKMIDLLVAANLGLWWRAYERA